ncbi:YkgJ family cysteine cluster protein [Maribacter polysiphoniae]|uniref:Putative zinc-or iron-chelating protein n=1 Tax=Maribacter polysiphoniae TaxID=429344 RepID=A0A316DZ53_9FLAO|nr:YkgJ family cysteine cluster protein [Maribacter polysiphoniae]MBD1262122.1 YkgJ family cysteine cluster protein [Maribacter polysiphoniae]PWK21813.1 putative zinc- or iron-chelating protein [Maribacter polysiphoniae]
MSIERRVQLVENLFLQLEKESTKFQQTSGIGCITGCGKCCTYPDVEASPLEFLPWAFHLFLNGEAEKTLLLLNKSTDLTCMIYKPLSIIGQGRCSDYKYRGLICRLFGFAANTDKYGKLRLATCKIIKEGQPENYNKTADAITKDLSIPVFTEYYMQLNQIDFHLGNIILPVNKALKMALEEVLQYYAYRPMPVNGKNALPA